MISDKIKQQANMDNNLSLYPSFIGKTMNIEIANFCNEKCVYCEYSAQGLHNNHQMIDEQLFYRITKEARELGITDIGLYITGEPFLNPNLEKYVLYLKKDLQFPYVYLSTNGISFNQERLYSVIDAGLDSLKFSISSSSRDNFLKHHGVDGFNVAFENVKAAYDYREKNEKKIGLYLFAVQTKYNSSEINDIKQMYGPFVDELIVSPVISSPFVKGVMETLSVSDNTLRTAMIGKEPPCSQPFNRIVITSEGMLCSCCVETRTGLTIVEDVNNKSLKEALYSENFLKVRKMHLNREIEGTICETCMFGRTSEKFFNVTKNKEFHLVDIEIDISKEIEKRFFDNEKFRFAR